MAEQLYNAGEKSIGLRHVGKYNLIEVPSVKKKKYMESDYKAVFSHIEELYNYSD